MPLSEQEQRLLEEMERSLYHNDADFVAAVNPHKGRVSYRRLIVGILVALVGIGVLLAGVIIRQPLLGVLGFAVMFAGVLVSVAPSRTSSLPSSSIPHASGAGSAAGKPSSFMSHLNDRWDRRQNGS